MLLIAYIPLVLLIALLYRLARIRAYQGFPLFFTYVAYAAAAGVLRLFSENNRQFYFFAYWITEIGYALLGALVLYEAFRVAFMGLRKAWWFRLLIPFLVALATVLVAVYTHRHPQGGGSETLAAILAFEFEVRLLQGFLFSAFVFLMLILQMKWPQYVFGVVAGFGLYATVALLNTIGFHLSERNFTLVWGGIQLADYSVMILIWLWTFRIPPRPEPPSRYPGGLPAAMQDADRYMRLLRKIRHHKPL